MTRTHYTTILLVPLALAICTGSLQATTTLAAPSVTTLALTCDTVLGPGAAPLVGIKLASGSTALTVAVTAVNGLGATLANGGGITLPSSQSVTSSASNTNFSFVANPGCKGASFGTNAITLTFTPPSPGAAVTVAATLTVTSNGTNTNMSALAPSPSSVALSCTKTGTTYSAQTSQAVNVLSAAPGGTPFTVDTTVSDPNAVPAWLSVTPTLGAANIAGVGLTFTTATNCGNLPVGTTSFNVHLLNAPAVDKVIPVTVQVGTGTTLTATPSTVTIAYSKGDTYSSDAQNTVISTSATAFYSVDPTTLPLWLNVSAGMSGTPTGSGTNVTLTFVPTAGAQTLSPGVYTANVHLKVSGQLDTVVPVSMQLSNAAPSLSIGEGSGARTVNWTFGSALPTLVITPVSSDSPIPFTVTTTAGTLSPQVSITSGLAYSFGTPISVTFLQSVFATFTLGMTAPTGTVTINYGTSSHIDVVLTLNIVSPAANITAISPSTVATASSGSFPLALTGTGFQSTTVVGIVSGGLIIPDTNIAVNVVNSTTIVLTVTVPGSADPLLPLGAAGAITIGVCNPGSGSSCSTATGTAVLHIGVNPIVQAVTSASSYAEVTPPALQQVAPYDILSIFGTNFCVSNATGCISPNPTIMYGKTDPVTLRYLTSLSPDASGATQRNLTVGFYQHNTSATPIATAPLLFATNGQINLIVPSAVSAFIGQAVDVVVGFGYGAANGGNLLQSSPYTVLIAASDPGVFTTSGDGQGQAAALANSTGALLTQAAPTVARSTATDSDVVQLYVTGLGAPDSDGSTAEAYPNNSVTCMSVAGYYTAVNSSTSATLTTDDGLVLQHTLFTSGQYEPCLTVSAAPSVTIGGVAASVLFAGWVSDSVAGLYQIDVQLPATTAGPFTDAAGASAALAGTARNLPVVVTMPSSGPSSQATGVNIWAIRGLKVSTTGTTAPGGVITVAAGHSSALSGVAVVASEGASTYTYSVLSGALPAGLTLNANGTITGTPAQGTATVVFGATDSTSGTALTGTISIYFNIS